MNEYPNPMWEFPITGRVANKRSRRSGVDPQNDFEHIGVDGSVEGGLEPFHGFKTLKVLTGNLGIGVEQFSRGVFWVSWRISDTDSAYGAVYRKTRVNGECRYFLEYRKASDSTWYGPVDLLDALQTTGLQDMDVRVVGKFVWVFVEGEEPFFFYVDETIADPFIRVVTDTGAGEACPFTAEDKNIGWADLSYNNINATYQNLESLGFLSTAALCQLQPPTDFSAAGKVFVLEMNEDDAYWFLPLKGPSALTIADMSVWNNEDLSVAVPTLPTPTQENPEFSTNSAWLYAGTLWKSGLSGVTIHNFDYTAGVYKFVYQLFDSRTGRRSNYSDFLERAVTLGVGAANHVGSADAAARYVGFPLLELVYDGDRWDTLFVFRTVEGDSTYKIDRVLTLADYEVDEAFQPTTPWRRALYFYELTDAQLDGVGSLVNFVTYDAEMPTAGAAIFHEGMMLFGNLATPLGENSGVGTVRYSDPTQVSVELVRPYNIYYLQQPTDEIVRFNYAGPNIIGFSYDAVYLFRKQNIDVLGFPLHAGMGIVHPWAAAEVASGVYYASQTALRILGPDGSISDVDVVKRIMSDEWADNIDKVRVGYDATMNAVFVLLSSEMVSKTWECPREKMVVLWLDTNRMTEVYDATFTGITQGRVPDDATITDSPVRNRAVFVQDFSQDDGSYSIRLMVVDRLRERTIAYSGHGGDLDGLPRSTLMDIQGDSCFKVLSLVDDRLGLNTTEENLVAGFEQATIYVVWSANPELVGRSSRVLRRIIPVGAPLGFYMTLQDPGEFEGIAVDDIVALSPVYFRWTGPLLGVVSENQMEFATSAVFRQRQVSTVGAAFGDVTVSGVPTDYLAKVAKYHGLVWKNDSDEPTDRAWPSDPRDRARGPLQSLVEGPGVTYASMGGDRGIRGGALAVSVEIIAPDCQWSLLGVKVGGRVEAKSREQMQ